ncbi:MAG: GspE/PulE family protein [Patescibacteria group bacterium]
MTQLDILVEKKIIKKADVTAITEEAKNTSRTIEQVLAGKGIPPQVVASTIGEYFKIPMKELGERTIPAETLAYVPEESAEHYRFVPLEVRDGVLEVGIVDPDNIEAKDALNFISSRIDMPFKLFVISETDFLAVLEMYKGLTEEVGKALYQLGTANSDGVSFSLDSGGELPGEDSNKMVEAKDKNNKIVEVAPITKIVATILRYATEGNASDVHIEHLRDTIRVRFRVDGVLNTSLVLPANVHASIISRIKILCNMKLDEKRKPQDGRFSATIEGRKVDFRVSTFPTYFGEKIVMRILDQSRGIKTLDDLGLSEKNLAAIRKAVKRPYGLILISGPTGSGKSTTLYGMLNELDRDKANVLSLEDPIEYSVEGVSQSQIRPEIGYTFANALRTTLRQDPDIIMVGEIRDEETAALAIHASLTGHLVLATIHTNNAVGVISRLIDMKIDPYLIAPTLALAVAQRLVVKLCPNSGEPMPMDGSTKAMIDKQFEDLPEKFKKGIDFTRNVYRAAPGPDCPTGTRGRVAAMEVLEVDKEMEALILKNPTEVEIIKLARSKGMLTMREDGILKAFDKQIPFEEILSL